MWFTQWSKKHREVTLAAAAAENERQQRAARRRVLEQATVLLPVMAPRRAPLFTRGQAARSGREQ